MKKQRLNGFQSDVAKAQHDNAGAAQRFYQSHVFDRYSWASDFNDIVFSAQAMRKGWQRNHRPEQLDRPGDFKP